MTTHDGTTRHSDPLDHAADPQVGPPNPAQDVALALRADRMTGIEMWRIVRAAGWAWASHRLERGAIRCTERAYRLVADEPDASNGLDDLEPEGSDLLPGAADAFAPIIAMAQNAMQNGPVVRAAGTITLTNRVCPNCSGRVVREILDPEGSARCAGIDESCGWSGPVFETTVIQPDAGSRG